MKENDADALIIDGSGNCSWAGLTFSRVDSGWLPAPLKTGVRCRTASRRGLPEGLRFRFG